MSKVILFNPWSARYGYRIPNSILQVAASIHGHWEYTIVDGNREKEPWEKIEELLLTEEYGYFCSTVMPGPQLRQAIPFAKRVKHQFPNVVNIWGGYFASNQFRTIMGSGWVDYIIDGPGDEAFPNLLKTLENGHVISGVPNLIFRQEKEIHQTGKQALLDQDKLPALPYENLFDTYSPTGYLKKIFLGSRTAAYHSSIGCPFTCSFCAVVPIYNARWKGKSAQNVYRDSKFLKENYGANAIEFHDNNFFVSEKRTVEFSELILPEQMNWWGEGRIDTIDKYQDRSLERMRESGCRMVFFGAESGNDEILAQMDKGGTQSSAQILEFAARMRKFDIIPEYSFVLGLPAESPQKVMNQIDLDIAFIKQVKEINPQTEIIIYVYSPVPTEGSELFETIQKAGFRFPENLEDWLSPEWENFDLRKNPLTPWLTSEMIDKIRDFETVLNSYYPTVSDFKLSRFQRQAMRWVSSLRYRKDLFRFPYELKVLQKFWLKYRRPEVEGFSMEP